MHYKFHVFALSNVQLELCVLRACLCCIFGCGKFTTQCRCNSVVTQCGAYNNLKCTHARTHIRTSITRTPRRQARTHSWPELDPIPRTMRTLALARRCENGKNVIVFCVRVCNLVRLLGACVLCCCWMVAIKRGTINAT